MICFDKVVWELSYIHIQILTSHQVYQFLTLNDSCFNHKQHKQQNQYFKSDLYQYSYCIVSPRSEKRKENIDFQKISPDVVFTNE